MKKIILIIAFVMLFTGCKNNNNVTVAVEKGFENKTVTDTITSYFENKTVEFKEVERGEIALNKYDVSVGGIPMGKSLGFDVWKSNVITHENALCVSYNDYKMSTDFGGKKIGAVLPFNYSDYIVLPSECEYESYESEESAFSDLKEKVIDGIICSSDLANRLLEKDNNLRVNDLFDSEIYEYVVISDDIELINSLDKVIE